MSAIRIDGNVVAVAVSTPASANYNCYVCGRRTMDSGHSMFNIPLDVLGNSTSNTVAGMSSWVCAECLARALNSGQWSLMNQEAINAGGIASPTTCENCSEDIKDGNKASFCDNCYPNSCSNCGDDASTLCWSCGDHDNCHDDCSNSCYECGNYPESETVLCERCREARDKQVIEDNQPVTATAAEPVNNSVTASDEGVELVNAMGDTVEVNW